MSIHFRSLHKDDINYAKVIDLYKEAFAGAQRIPTSLLRYKLRNGKIGFDVIYDNDKWIGLLYAIEIKDIFFVQFLAIAPSIRSGGYGSKVMELLKSTQAGKRIVLNIEELNEEAENYPQRLKRKAFYENNGFRSAGYLVKESAQHHEMLIRGGSINKEEIDAMYKKLLGVVISFFIRPKVIKI